MRVDEKPGVWEFVFTGPLEKQMICPFCREAVQHGAVKCRYCHEPLETEHAKWAIFRMKFLEMNEQEQAAAWAKLTADQRRYIENPQTMAVRLVPQKSDVGAFFLGLLLGPVGLWYKGHWPAGFAWLAMALLAALSGVGLIFFPVFWFGMAIHAAIAKPS